MKKKEIILMQYTPLQRRELASTKMASFFSSLSPELKAKVESLPKRIERMNARVSVKLQEILRTTDELFNHASGYVACTQGCSHCCHVSIPIADFEASYMGTGLNIKPAQIKQSIRRDVSEFSTQTPCNFLKDGSCSIYNFRPLTCRIHVNFDIDNYWCHHENWNKPEAGIARPTIHAIVEAYHLLSGKAEPIVADIRDYFPNGKN
jgi:uncharacterized protein